MESLFDYDPPSWYDDSPERQAEVREEHARDRLAFGVSKWDLYNFDSYYISLIFYLSRENKVRHMGLSQMATLALDEIFETAGNIERLEEESDELFNAQLASAIVDGSLSGMNMDKIKEIDDEQSLLKSSVIETFIFDILPILPVGGEDWVRAEVDRVPHGIAEADYQSIGSTMLDRLVTGLNRFAKYSADETNPARSHPGYYTLEEWTERIKEMETAILKLSTESDFELTEDERKKFVKDFQHLWV